MTIVRQLLPGTADLSEIPELTSAALETARLSAAVGCLIDRVYRGHPLIISFAFREPMFLQRFDFFGRTKKLEKTFDVSFNRILLRDVFNGWYHRGVPGLGRDVDEVTASLRGLVDAIRPRRVITIGQSMGAYAAIMYGMLLGAQKIVAFGPLSHLDATEANRFNDSGFLAAMEALQMHPPKCIYRDLVSLGREVDYQGELHVIFGTHPGHDDGVSANFDAVHALRLAQLPNTFLEPYPESDHPVVAWLVDHGKMDDVLARLLIADSFPDRAAKAPTRIRQLQEIH